MDSEGERTAKDRVTLCAVGDVGADRNDPSTLFTHVSTLLNEADITFGQLELPITERGARVPQARVTARSEPRTAKDLRDAGFDVMSFASNHVMDWGPDALFDTIGSLEREGVQVAGAGADLATARAPRIVEVAGTRVAFLAYCSILPAGYWATDTRPGCAPMRAFTHYEQTEPDQPGTPARTRSFPHPEDLDDLVADIGSAKSQADVVVLSIHWGIHFQPAVLAEYQRVIAHTAIDAGADLIAGHHPHILKGVEVYGGKPIFYSLCNFAIDLLMDEEFISSPEFQELRARLNPAWDVDPAFYYNFPNESAMSAAVTCEITNGRISKVGLTPIWIDRTATPRVVGPSEERFDQIVAYLQRISDQEGLGTRFRSDGDVITFSADDR